MKTLSDKNLKRLSVKELSYYLKDPLSLEHAEYVARLAPDYTEPKYFERVDLGDGMYTIRKKEVI